MIEKFSEEELSQILFELGIKEKGTRTEWLVADEQRELLQIFESKPSFNTQNPKGKAYECVNGIVSLTLNNIIQTQKGHWRISGTVKESDKEEFKKMFQEILEIIKKHNRGWEDKQKLTTLSANSKKNIQNNSKDIYPSCDQKKKYEWNTPGIPNKN